VLTTRNPSGLHGFVSSLAPAELDQLVRYLEQIDNEDPVRTLPFEPPPVAAGAGGQSAGAGTSASGGLGSGGAAGFGAAAGVSNGIGGNPVAAPPPADPGTHAATGCGCKLAPASQPDDAAFGICLLGLTALRLGRGARRRESHARAGR